ncbi:MAG: hypothetical protein ACE5IC_10105 [Candidatus Brocadiales bacterium]
MRISTLNNGKSRRIQHETASTTFSLFLLMSLLTIASVSSTDYLYAYGNTEGTAHLGAGDDPFGYIGTSGYLDTKEKREFVYVFKTDTLENAKFQVERLTKCSVIDAADYLYWIALRIVIDEGPHEGETGWVWVQEFVYHPDEG